MWLDEDLVQLSLGTQVYSHRDRYSVENPYPRDWNLVITSVRTDDAGLFHCRIRTRQAATITKTVQLIVEGSLSVRLSVYPSVTSQCSTKTAKLRIMQTMQ